MSNLDYRKEIRETENKMLNLECKQTQALLRDRMRFLRLLKTGECSSQAKASKVIGIGLRCSEKLWKKYRIECLEGLLDYPFKGRKQKLDDHTKEALINELGKDSTQGLQQACRFVEEQSGVHYTVSGMHHVLKRLKIKKKTGRPVHYQKDVKGEKRFKKKGVRAIEKRYGRRHIFFEDEVRTGTRSQSKRRWTPKGHRPVCWVKLGYEFCYLYAALAPATGDLIALILPDMSKKSFEVFLDYFREQTRTPYGNSKVVLIADKAGSHQQSICNQRGIGLERLPTACPELIPVERFFEELRKPLADHIFENIEEVETYLCKILKRYYNHPEQIVQLYY